jgi:uncharacterized protein (TIGR02996 family)
VSDEPALLAAIAEHPDEDTPRLVYADWLDDQDTVSAPCDKCAATGWRFPGLDGLPKCPDCSAPTKVMACLRKEQKRRYRCVACRRIWRPFKCLQCRGERRVDATLTRQRAEFIRVQIELSHMTPPAELRAIQIDKDPGSSIESLRRSKSLREQFEPNYSVVRVRFRGTDLPPQLLRRGDLIDLLGPTWLSPTDPFRVVLGARVDSAEVLEIDQPDWLLEVKLVADRDYYPDRARLNALRDRERALFTAHGVAWLAGQPGADEAPAIHPGCTIHCGLGRTTNVYEYVFRRGFPELVVKGDLASV